MNLRLLLTSGFVFTAFCLQAQERNMAYAITGDGNNDFIWMNIRQVDLTTGQVKNTVFERSKTNYTLTDIHTRKSVDQNAIVNGNIFSTSDYPTSTYVAAAAYDNRTNRLYFTPMRMSELRWMDTDAKGNPKFYTMKVDAFQPAIPNDESKHITRMVIASDGFGYAVTNDGNHLYRFTTGKVPVVTDLGNLIDAASNGQVSVHNKCTSWGGDMIADAFGKLYIISANKNVFMVDPATRIATFKGAITGLPAAYTTNAAAVSPDGDIIVTSANYFQGYYKVKLTDLSAVKIEGSDARYNAADLAGGNLLLEKEAAAKNRFDLPDNNLPGLFADADSRVYPNPVTSSKFMVSLAGFKDGRYSIVLSDVTGRALQSSTIQLTKANQVEQVSISSKPVKGIYMVKVIDSKNTIVHTEKIVLE